MDFRNLFVSLVHRATFVDPLKNGTVEVEDVLMARFQQFRRRSRRAISDRTVEHDGFVGWVFAKVFYNGIGFGQVNGVAQMTDFELFVFANVDDNRVVSV